MDSGFPLALVESLRCSMDAAELEADPSSALTAAKDAIVDGSLACARCRRRFGIREGIVDMITELADDESRHEQAVRDDLARRQDLSRPAWFDKPDQQLEIVPTMEALAAAPEQRLLELGCGDGRYTIRVAPLTLLTLAVDFSRASLEVLRRRLAGARNVGLVHADATTLNMPAAHFDRVFSTLMSNLPTREHRDRLYRRAAHALKPGGRFVYSTHHHTIRDRLAGRAKSGHYRAGGIYRYNFSVGECAAEVRPYFAQVEARPIHVYLPLARTLRLPLMAQSRLGERIPGVNRLGELVLCTAQGPLNAAA